VKKEGIFAGGNLVRLYQREFEIKPLSKSNFTSITYWFDLQVGLNFLASPGLKVILSRNDHKFNSANPYACLLEKSCVISRLADKNILRLNVLLTSGNYRLTFLEELHKNDDGSNINSKSLRHRLDALQKPLQIKLQANNVIQNEER
jgi:hypothetical protein